MGEITIIEQLQEEDKNVKMLTRVLSRCEQMFRCMKIFRRTDHILELQEGTLTKYKDVACAGESFDGKIQNFQTFFKEDIGYQACPLSGIHEVIEIDLDGQSERCQSNGFTNINIQCGDSDVIHFYKECQEREGFGKLEVTSSSVYHCLGGWAEPFHLEMVEESLQ